MKTNCLILLLCIIIIGCAHNPELRTRLLTIGEVAEGVGDQQYFTKLQARRKAEQREEENQKLDQKLIELIASYIEQEPPNDELQEIINIIIARQRERQIQQQHDELISQRQQIHKEQQRQNQQQHQELIWELRRILD